jgi:predicted NBD/HSP70 family sugar kinase
MGAGATRGRDGTIPTVASGTDLPRDRHIAAAARLEQALAAAEQRYVSAADAIFAAIEQFGELGRYDAGLLAWLETEQKNLRDRIFMIRGALKNVRDHLGRL